ncbi:pseudouridine synthase [Eisenibacter elegans]|uniref:pseudouridine synthase n=1 Tax=Eisenibacter elegans TaxID=997 RepID=UPI00041521A5|nr:pseudouridine synthase [Eisenibacter elegans]
MQYYYLIYKPFLVLSQFTPEAPEDHTLAELADFPPQVYPVGRLDKDSEGLLLLTNDNYFKTTLLNPKKQHWRSYWVQVEGVPTPEALEQLRQGVTISVQQKPYQTLPAKVRLLAQAPPVPERNPPIRFRANIPTAWLEISLVEGKNRQVRRMTAAVGFPTLRLVRNAIEDLKLQDFDFSQTAVYPLSQAQAYQACRIAPENSTYAKPKNTGKRQYKRPQNKPRK